MVPVSITILLALLCTVYYADGTIPQLSTPFKASRWLGRQSNDDGVSVVNGGIKDTILRACRLRGGESSQEPSKVKGLCVGIDLGTTYR